MTAYVNAHLKQIVRRTHEAVATNSLALSGDFSIVPQELVCAIGAWLLTPLPKNVAGRLGRPLVLGVLRSS